MSNELASKLGLDEMEQEAGYRQHYLNLEFWRPYLLEVCRRHDLAPVLPLQMGVPGTYPTFIVGGHWVVKFFGRMFDGEGSFRTERELTQRLSQLEDFPAPAMVASGSLFPDGESWPWPYLVQEYLPGVSFGEIGSILGRRVRLQLATELGELLRRLHSLQTPTWEPYLDFLSEQRAACLGRLEAWGWMPAALLEQVEGYLLPPETLIDPGEPPHWIHMDVTRDHLIGRWSHGKWTSLGLIDFGDGRTGSLYFELPALHLDFFETDGRLLAAFLDAYGYIFPQNAAFRRKALTACLLHPLDVLGGVWDRWLSPNPPHSLEALAVRLFSQSPVID